MQADFKSILHSLTRAHTYTVGLMRAAAGVSIISHFGFTPYSHSIRSQWTTLKTGVNRVHLVNIHILGLSETHVTIHYICSLDVYAFDYL